MMNEHGEDARYEFVPSPQVKAPWTVDDFDMCVTLVTKARYHRVFDNVMKPCQSHREWHPNPFRCLRIVGWRLRWMLGDGKRRRSDDRRIQASSG